MIGIIWLNDLKVWANKKSKVLFIPPTNSPTESHGVPHVQTHFKKEHVQSSYPKLSAAEMLLPEPGCLHTSGSDEDLGHRNGPPISPVFLRRSNDHWRWELDLFAYENTAKINSPWLTKRESSTI